MLRIYFPSNLVSVKRDNQKGHEKKRNQMAEKKAKGRQPSLMELCSLPRYLTWLDESFEEQ